MSNESSSSVCGSDSHELSLWMRCEVIKRWEQTMQMKHYLKFSGQLSAHLFNSKDQNLLFSAKWVAAMELPVKKFVIGRYISDGCFIQKKNNQKTQFCIQSCSRLYPLRTNLATTQFSLLDSLKFFRIP